MTSKTAHELLEMVDQLLEHIEDNFTADFKVAKRVAGELRDELEEVLESLENHS